MATNKKYYYLKLKENFYESEQLIILQNMQDGYLYSDILMKLYLRSLKTEGKLMFNDLIPYTPSILAQIVRHQVGTVEKALKIFKELGLIEILDNGAIYMMDIQNFIGKSSSEGDRKREYRNKIQNEKNNLLGQMSDKRPPEIELEIEKDIEIEKDKEKENFTDTQKKKTNNITYFLKIISNNNYKYIKENNDVYNKITEWLNYKQERKELYKEIGLNNLLKQIEKNIDNYGEDNVIDLISECMANNYKGIIFNKISNKQEDKYKGMSYREQEYIRQKKLIWGDDYNG